MDSRTRLLITASLVCHLLLIPPLVTSQLLPSPSSPSSSAGVQEATQAVTIRAQHQERDGAIYRLRGNVAIDYGTYRFSGDEVVYNSETRAIDAEGHLVLEGGPNDEYVEAVRASYNLGSEDGRFEQVTGTIGLKRPRSRNFLSSSQPFYFTGRMVEKRGPDHYIVYDGTVTTCDLPHPKWRFYSHKVVVEVGGNANIYNTNFRLSGVPVLYLPFATHPVQKQPRQSGFLIPNIGRSSTRGYTFGESFFWKINRSMDLHAGAEYFSRR
ncbi:MAG: LPS-assembly protein LptD, partial [Acidobacteria bacterium]|nr:LPS-assembly protein LptD [Acidobacteriota bacterium]